MPADGKPPSAMAASLLFIVEQGGYSLYLPEFEQQGYQVETVITMRKALARLKSTSPDIIIAEFNFEPTFRDRVSNIEPLLATLQAHNTATKLILLLEREYDAHLEKVRGRFPIHDRLFHPVEFQPLLTCVQRAMNG